MIRAVIFDFDGVICQTETYKLDQMAVYLKQLGLQVDIRQLYRLAGGTSIERDTVMDEIFGSQPCYRQVREQALHFHMGPFPHSKIRTEGIVETLEELKRRAFCLGVASNSREERLRAALEDCQVLSYFNVIASAFDLNRRKPDPYVYTYTMGLMGVKPDQCVIVEDSALGIQAGKAAGAKVIALKDRDGAIDQREADVIIERIEQLLNYVEIDK
jgi:beta-phosphoglucomutase-like phosphatase (HAD superfamily)